MKYLKVAFPILLLSMNNIPYAFSQGRGMIPVEINIDGTPTTLYTQSHALVIGVSDYTNGWSDLPGVNRDIEAVRSVLQNQGFYVTVVKNPNQQQLKLAFDDFISNYSREYNSRLLVYFSGHGHTMKKSWGGEMGYIVPADAPNPHVKPEEFKDKAIDMELMEVYAKRMDSKHALFLFDCCFSGSIFSLSKSFPAIISYKTSQPVRQFITAGEADEEVPDESVFCRQFVSGISGEADMNNDGYVTGSELGEYLQTTVVNYTYETQHPQYGKIRDLNLDKGDYVFVSNSIVQPIENSKFVNIENTIPLCGTIHLTSNRCGRLYIDGIYQDQIVPNSLITINNITPGYHVVKIIGSATWIQDINIIADSTIRIEANIIDTYDSKKTKPKNNINNITTANSGIFIDIRDSNEYRWININGMTWMAENLNVGRMISGTQMQKDNSVIEKYCYKNKISNCDIYGGLYQWKEMLNYSLNTQGICPEGWHVPSSKEWEALIDAFGGENIAASQLKSYDGNHWKTSYKLLKNNSNFPENGFNILPSGYRSISIGKFVNLNRVGIYRNSNDGSSYMFLYDSNKVLKKSIDNKGGFSVRCVKN